MEHDPDRQCEYIFEEGHPKAGQKCTGPHTRDSAYCGMHGERKQQIVDARAEKAKKLRELSETVNSYHGTCTREDVQKLTEIVINGVMTGVIKKDKAGPLAVFLPFAYKMAKEMDVPKPGGLRIDLTKTTETVTLSMSEEEMDAYLSGNDSVKIEIIEQAKAEGKIKIENNEIIAEEVEPEKIKIDNRSIARISQKTDQPITAEQSKKLFGTNMKDTPQRQGSIGASTQGFSELFESGIPEGSLHEWKGKYEKVEGKNVAALWYTCQKCGKRSPNSDQRHSKQDGEFCPGAQ